MSSARFDAYARELLDAYNSKEIEEVITPYGKKATAYRVANCGHFIELVRDFMIAEGMAKSGDFQHMDQTDVETVGSMANLRSIFNTENYRLYGLKIAREKEREAELKARLKSSRTFATMDPVMKSELLAELQEKKSTPLRTPED